MYLKLEGKKLVEHKGEPDLPESGISLETIYCGICGSDKHRIQTGNGNILGHENVARVIENKGRFSKGDLVAVNPLIPCKECEMCRCNQSNICENMSSLGKDLPGGFCSKIVAPEENLYPIKRDSKKFVLADPLAVVIHALRQIDYEDKKILVIGDGALGALTCFYVSEKSDKIHIKGRDKSKIQKITQNTNASDKLESNYDIIFEAVGGEQSETLNLAAENISKRGNIVVYGVFPDKNLELNLRPALEKEARIIGINSYRNDGKIDDFQTAINIIENNDLDYLVETFEFSYQNIVDSLDKKLIKAAIKY